MGMSEMGAACPMAHAPAADCGQGCCNHSAPKAMLWPAALTKPKMIAASVMASLVAEFDFAVAQHSDWQPDKAAANHRPLYILHRVFRI